MKYTELRKSLNVSRIAFGCWRMDALSDRDAVNVVNNALENGINFFDNADIYGGGVSEEKFGQAVKALGCKREDLIIQSKAGIFLEENYYDFSRDHILEAVDGSLKRMQTEYMDILLLHRPDTLFEPEEVAEAFDILQQSGKVRWFGVSNQNPGQIELLKKYVRQDLIVNQMQFSVMHSGMVDSGLAVNNNFNVSIVKDGGILEYSRLHDIRLQAWSPFQYGLFEGVYIGNPKFPELNQMLEKIGEEQGVSGSAVAAAWILRHPAFAQIVSGSMTPSRLDDVCRAVDVELTKKQWYDIYKAAGKIVP
ncbi:MAG: aldo/keto reductase [Eubacteriales bacterium]|nr:aldo/keto reductase [Eubacteriales bacterium]